MTIPFACVLVAFLLIYIPRLFVAAAQARQPEGFDNKNPRDQQSKLFNFWSPLSLPALARVLGR